MAGDTFWSADHDPDRAAPPTRASPYRTRASLFCLGYFKAFLNTYAGDAWAAVAPHTVPVLGAFAANPVESNFNEKSLPRSISNRVGVRTSSPVWMAADWYVNADTLRLQWVFPRNPQEKQSVHPVQHHQWAGEASSRRRSSASATPASSSPATPTRRRPRSTRPHRGQAGSGDVRVAPKLQRRAAQRQRRRPPDLPAPRGHRHRLW